ncbi:MAG: WS/DGAT domain-containing protein, partial [Myxococcota bacterium]
ILFWVPQSGSVGLGLSIFSYAGKVTVGLSADVRCVAEPARVLSHLEASLAELEAAVPVAVSP